MINISLIELFALLLVCFGGGAVFAIIVIAFRNLRKEKIAKRL